MNLSLNATAEKLIVERIKSGKYATPEDVVTAALHSLEQEERVGEFAPGDLDRLVAEGDASGAPLGGETGFAELRAKHQARTKHR